MGLLDILNGMQNGPRGATKPGQGGMSPLTMGLLALLAYKAFQKLNTGSPQPQPAPSGRPPAVPRGQTAAPDAGGLGSLLPGGLGGLGGLLAGAAGGAAMSGGLNDLLRQLDQNGLGNIGQSWVGSGTNHGISPGDLRRALGDDTINALAGQTGMSDMDVLSALSEELPSAVDQITPHGRMPTDDEMSSML